MSSMQEAPKEIYDMLSNSASNAFTYLDSDDREIYLNSLMKIVETNCKLDVRLQKSSEIFNRLTEQHADAVENDEVCNDQETLDRFKNEVAGIDDRISNHKYYLAYKEQIKALSDNMRTEEPDDEDGELVFTRNDVHVIDPITKKRMTDPVKNSICGHVYERESITALLQANKKTRCPVVGCGSKGYVQLGNLQLDIITKNYLDRNPET